MSFGFGWVGLDLVWAQKLVLELVEVFCLPGAGFFLALVFASQQPHFDLGPKVAHCLQLEVLGAGFFRGFWAGLDLTEGGSWVGLHLGSAKG